MPDLMTRAVGTVNRPSPLPDTYGGGKNVLMGRIPMLRSIDPKTVVTLNAPPNDINPNWVAHTRGSTISVDKPDLFDMPTLLHELVHVWQNTRNEGATYGTPKLQPGWTYIDPYEYGAVSGLENLRKEGKTIADLGVEQQARMVQDYFSYMRDAMLLAKQGKWTPERDTFHQRVVAAYEPFLQQMQQVPKLGAKINADALPPTLPSPQVPSPGVTGLFSVPSSIGGGGIIMPIQRGK